MYTGLSHCKRDKTRKRYTYTYDKNRTLHPAIYATMRFIGDNVSRPLRSSIGHKVGVAKHTSIQAQFGPPLHRKELHMLCGTIGEMLLLHLPRSVPHPVDE